MVKRYRVKPVEVEVIIFDEMDVEPSKKFVGSYLQSGGGITTLWMGKDGRFERVITGDVIVGVDGNFTIIPKWMLDDRFVEIVDV